jgi:hypothetical protein
MKAETTIELSTGRRFDVLEPIEDIEAWIGGQARLLKLHVVRNGHVKRLSLHTGTLISAESGAREPVSRSEGFLGLAAISPRESSQPPRGMRYVVGQGLRGSPGADE